MNKLDNTIDINEEILINNLIKIQCDIPLFRLINKFFIFLYRYWYIDKAKHKCKRQIIINKEKELTNNIVVYFHKEDKTLLTLLCQK